MIATHMYSHKLNHKFLGEVKAAEKGVCLSEGNEAAENDGTTLDFTWKSPLKETLTEVLTVA